MSTITSSAPTSAPAPMRLALGPLQYYWPREAVLRFYQDIACSPVDVVYLGEAVCSRRHELRLNDWLDIALRLRDAGKEVLLSTQILVESGSDASAVQRIADAASQHGLMVEANDMGAVSALAGRTPFVAGPHLNIYNLPALEWIASLGACRWVAPLEMKHSDISQIQASRPQGVQTEIFAFGRMPLAFSARCFTARHRNLHKDNCGFSCVDYPDGLLLRTREQEEFLVLNGIQIQSARVCNLAADLPALQSMGANILRLSPQSQHMPEIITLWRTALDGQIPAAEAATRINTLLPAPACNGYWHGTAGMTQLTP